MGFSSASPHQPHPTETEFRLGAFVASLAAPQAVSGGASLDFLIRAGGRSLHAAATLSLGGDFTTQFFEGPTVVSPGAGIAAINQDRASLQLATGEFFSGPSVSADGLRLISGLALGGGEKKAIDNPGITAGTSRAWKLAKNTDYLLRLTNETAGALDAHVVFGWIETDT